MVLECKWGLGPHLHSSTIITTSIQAPRWALAEENWELLSSHHCMLGSLYVVGYSGSSNHKPLVTKPTVDTHVSVYLDQLAGDCSCFFVDSTIDVKSTKKSRKSAKKQVTPETINEEPVVNKPLDNSGSSKPVKSFGLNFVNGA